MLLFDKFDCRVLEEAGDGEGGGGAPEPKPNDPPKEKPASPPADTVSKAEFDKVMAELHKHKSQSKKYADEVQEAKLARMKEQNQWKEIAETKEREALDAKAEANKVKDSYLNHQKYTAVREKVLALGLRPEALTDLDMLDLNDVSIETTSIGRINVLGADKFATSLKTLKPHWFQDKQATNFNPKNPKILDGSEPITVKDLLRVEKEGQKKGDLTEYYALHQKYRSQAKG